MRDSRLVVTAGLDSKASRPRGRRSVDLAGPPVRDLPARHDPGNVFSALAAARDLPQLSLVDALELGHALLTTSRD